MSSFDYDAMEVDLPTMLGDMPTRPLEDDVPNRAHATGAFSYRRPAPGRIIVPPPVIKYGRQVLAFDLNGSVLPQENVDVSFLNNIDHGPLFRISNNLSRTWTYTMRRDATEILPYLYLGPMSAARDKAALERIGITMMIAFQHRTNFPSSMGIGPVKVAKEMGIDNKIMMVRDNSELISTFPLAIRAINEHLHDFHSRHPHIMPKVLVFCESGNDRSAAVVAAYLMQMYNGVDLVKACQIVNYRRFSATVEEGTKQYLLAWQDILRAKRDARAALSGTMNGQAFGASGSLPNQKRGRCMDEDDDLQIDNDAERFLGRNSAPFVDSS